MDTEKEQYRLDATARDNAMADAAEAAYDRLRDEQAEREQLLLEATGDPPDDPEWIAQGEYYDAHELDYPDEPEVGPPGAW